MESEYDRPGRRFARLRRRLGRHHFFKNTDTQNSLALPGNGLRASAPIGVCAWDKPEHCGGVHSVSLLDALLEVGTDVRCGVSVRHPVSAFAGPPIGE